MRAPRLTKVHVFPYSPRPGTRTAAEDTVPPEVKKERSARLRALSDEACRARWASKIGREDVVLVDRPGRGYGADYSPWLVDGALGELVSVTGRAVTEEGILADVPPDDCLFCTLFHQGYPSRRRTASLRSGTSTRRRRPTCWSSRSVTSTRSATSPSSPPTSRSGCSTSSRRSARGAGLEDYRVLVNVGPGGGQTVFHLHWHILGGKIRGMPA